MLSPYHGGSHRAWAEGWRSASRHTIEILDLPARFWKWRMHGAAVTLARRFAAIDPVDAIVATDMLDLAAFLALTRAATATMPTLLYLHENQITYPLPRDPSRGPMRRQRGERDRHYGFVNFTSMLAADRIAFNSGFHRRELLGALPSFLRHFPDFRETERVAELERDSVVLPVGLRVEDLPPLDPGAAPSDPPLLLWNQRWEYDKDPATLMRVLVALADSGERFRVALCGQVFGRRPRSIDQGLDRLGDRVVHAGHLPRAEYTGLLGRATIVLSTARHEFFGVAVAEAVAAGAAPLVPDRLAYPELIPETAHAECLYTHTADLLARLRAAVRNPTVTRARGLELGRQLRDRLAWPRVAGAYDQTLDELAARDAGAAAATRGRD